MKILAFVILLLALCFWAPWTSPESATANIQKVFTSDYRSSNSLYAGSACTLESLTTPVKVAFGYSATATWDCEISGAGSGDITYTFYGSVMGAPSK